MTNSTEWSFTAEWQIAQIQINWLLWKPTDLELHCLQRQGISGFSRTRLNTLPSGLKIQQTHSEIFFLFFPRKWSWGSLHEMPNPIFWQKQEHQFVVYWIYLAKAKGQTNHIGQQFIYSTISNNKEWENNINETNCATIFSHTTAYRTRIHFTKVKVPKLLNICTENPLFPILKIIFSLFFIQDKKKNLFHTEFSINTENLHPCILSILTSKCCRPGSDVAECSIRSGFTLFVTHPAVF